MISEKLFYRIKNLLDDMEGVVTDPYSAANKEIYKELVAVRKEMRQVASDYSWNRFS